jgi:hypothetical protein
MSHMGEKKTYSISVRLLRTKGEYAFVSVPVNEHIWEQHPDDPKKQQVNGEKVFEIARSMGRDASVLWAREGEPLIEVHPWQIAPPRARWQV